jgi:hypothetical protein
MSERPTKEQPMPTISLKHHQRILFEIRTKAAAINLDLGAYQDPVGTAEELDALVEWIDNLGAKA